MTDSQAKRPTIHDVAREAGVAVGTVSRYLNGRPTRDSSARKIEETIAHLGFVRNLAAATMRNESSPLVGFLVSSYDEFQIQLLSQLTARMQAADRLVLPLTHDGSVETMKKALVFFAEHRVGAIVASGDFPAMAQMRSVIGPSTHVIIFNNDLPGLDADRIYIDDEPAMRQAITHLIEIGHRRIGYLAGRTGHSSAAGRFSGYRLALQDAGIAFDEMLVAGHDWTERAGYLGTQELLSLAAAPTAIAGSSYLNTIGAFECARERGVSIPNDLSLISFGDAEALRLMGPGIDTIVIPIDRMVDMIESCYGQPPDKRGGHKIKIDCHFIRRGSTAKPAG